MLKNQLLYFQKYFIPRLFSEKPQLFILKSARNNHLCPKYFQKKKKKTYCNHFMLKLFSELKQKLMIVTILSLKLFSEEHESFFYQFILQNMSRKCLEKFSLLAKYV